MPALISIALLPLLLSTAAGCADSAECDGDQRLEAGGCVPADAGSSGADGSGDGDSDAAQDAGMGDAGMPGDGGLATRPAADEGFGDPCTDDVDHSECNDTADFCAIMPGGTEGTCTATGCAEGDARCPEGWGCLDLSIFQAGLPSVCTEP
jgi:hypothetical protein